MLTGCCSQPRNDIILDRHSQRLGVISGQFVVILETLNREPAIFLGLCKIFVLAHRRGSEIQNKVYQV